MKVYLIFLWITIFSLSNLFPETPETIEAYDESHEELKEESPKESQEQSLRWKVKTNISAEYRLNSRKNSLQISSLQKAIPAHNNIYRLYNEVDLNMNYKDFFEFRLLNYLGWQADDNNRLVNFNDSIKRRSRDDFRELYFSFKITSSHILNIGRENILEGISYFFQPTDFLWNESLDNSQDPQNARNFRIGHINVKYNWFFDFGNLLLVYVPKIETPNYNIHSNQEQMGLVKFSYGGLENFSADFMILSHEKNSAAGSNFSYGIGDNLVLTFEAALKRGSRIQIPVNNLLEDQFVTVGPQSIPVAVNSFDYQERNNNFWFPKIVMGLNYTLPSNILLITEYIYSQEGYSNSELNDYRKSIQQVEERLYDPVFSQSTAVYTYLTQNQRNIENLQAGRLSQHYVATRLSKDNVFFDNLTSSVFIIMNAQDYSFMLRPSLVYTSDNAVFHLDLVVLGGSDDSEFGLLPLFYQILLKASLIF